MYTFKSILSFITAIILVVSVCGEEDGGPLLKIRQGELVGSQEKARCGRDFYGFKGIPYGKVIERFQAASAADAWTGVRNATNWGPRCAQYDCYASKFVGEENCLNLNVFTPRLPTSGQSTVLLPVVVIFPLGNHFFGSGEMFGPQYLMDEDVVVVTLNTRLGPFGFLNTGDTNAPGNVGLRDQTLSLQWIRDNIGHFSGDWKRVTLLGSGSGGSDILLHLFNPGSKGLFHRAVVGSAYINSCSFTNDPGNQARKLGEQVGCPYDKANSTDFVNCLNKMEPLDLLKKMKLPSEGMMDGNLEAMKEFATFSPSIEVEQSALYDRVVTEHPMKLIRTGKVVNNVPLIIGATAADGLDPFSGMYLNDTNLFNKLVANWNETVPMLLDFNETSTDPSLVAQKVWDFYVKNGTLTGQNLVDIFTDRSYEFLTKFVVKHLSANLPTYLYRFQHNPEFRVVDSMGYANTPSGPGNMDDLQYLFNMSHSFQVPVITDNSTPVEYILSRGLIRMLTSFFESGNPNKPWGEGKEWEQFKVDTESSRVYAIDTLPKMMEDSDSLKERIKFWDGISETYFTKGMETSIKTNQI